MKPLPNSWEDFEQRKQRFWISIAIIYPLFLTGSFTYATLEVWLGKSDLLFFASMTPAFVSFGCYLYAYYRLAKFQCCCCSKRFAFDFTKLQMPFDKFKKCKHCGCEVGCEDEFFLDEESQAK